MLQESLNNYFLIASVVIGFFAILLIWVYLLETAKGIYITELNVIKKYVNYPFAFSVIMLVVLWVTTTGLDTILIKCFWILSIGWIITAVSSLLISAFAKTEIKNKKAMRQVILPCIAKVIVMAIVLWLVF